MVIFFIIIFIIYFFIQNSLPSRNIFEFFNGIESPPYPPPNFQNNSNLNTNNCKSNSLTIDTITGLCSTSKEMENKYKLILDMIEKRDIQFNNLSNRVSNNEIYINKIKDAEQAINKPPS